MDTADSSRTYIQCGECYSSSFHYVREALGIICLAAQSSWGVPQGQSRHFVYTLNGQPRQQLLTQLLCYCSCCCCFCCWRFHWQIYLLTFEFIKPEYFLVRQLEGFHTLRWLPNAQSGVAHKSLGARLLDADRHRSHFVCDDSISFAHASCCQRPHPNYTLSLWKLFGDGRMPKSSFKALQILLFAAA